MVQETIDSRKLQRLLVQGQILADDIEGVIRSGDKPDSSKYEWNDYTGWQTSASRFIREADESLLENVKWLDLGAQSSNEHRAAISSTIIALNTLAALAKNSSSS